MLPSLPPPVGTLDLDRHNCGHRTNPRKERASPLDRAELLGEIGVVLSRKRPRDEKLADLNPPGNGGRATRFGRQSS
jgi:hypothetical protein